VTAKTWEMSKDMAYLENVRIRVRHLVRAASANQEVAALLGLAGVGVFFSLATPYFLTPLNLFQLTRQMAVLAVISVGAVYNLAANVMALLIARSGVSPWTSAMAAVAVGVIAGALNGSIAVVLGLPTLIVTLGTVSLFRGITIVLSGGLSIGNLPDSNFYQMGSEGVGPVPFVVLVALVFVAVLAWIYRKTVFVKQLLAIGSNADAAARVGVRTKLRKVQVMAVNGLMCGLAAVLGIAYLRAASPQSGAGYEMSAIAAVVVGGTPLTGGVGSVWGTLVGIALIVAIQNGLMLMGLPTAWQVASTGAMLLGAVALQQLVQLRRGT
jgi:ribose transport system permease protein